MRQLSLFFFGLAILVLMQGPLLGQKKEDSPGKETPKEKLDFKGKVVVPPAMVCPPGPKAPCLSHLDGLKLVFVADGAGANTSVCDNLSDLSGDLALGLRVQMVNWCRLDHKSHDFTDQPAQFKAAFRLAAWTKMIRRDCPNAEIYFIGQDAGARVILAAAEMLPEHTITRLITIAPGVSSTYDLRLAINATRCGLDNFWSTEDDFLERVVERRGTSDGGRGFAAGRVGFRMPAYCDPKMAAPYGLLRQHRWNDNLCGQGQHHAWVIKHNMKKCLVPLFFQPQVAYQPVPVFTPPVPITPSPPLIKMKEAK